MSELSSTRNNNSRTDTNTGLEIDASIQDSQREAIAEVSVEGDVFADSEDQSFTNDLKPSDETEVTERSDEVPILSESGDSNDGSDIPAESSIDISSQQLLASHESDVSSDSPAESIIENSTRQMQTQMEITDEKNPVQPNLINIGTPEHEGQPDTIDVLTQDVLNDANTSSHETHDSSLNRTMEQYNAAVLDECTKCDELQSSVSGLMNELQEKNDAIVELLEEQQFVLNHSEEIQSQNEKLETVVMQTAARMRSLMDEKERKDQVIEKLEEDIQKICEHYEKENKLLQIQVDNHNDKEKMMSENLNYYMDENVRLKNKRKVIPTDSSDSTDDEAAPAMSKLRKEFNRFKQYVDNNFVKKTHQISPELEEENIEVESTAPAETIQRGATKSKRTIQQNEHQPEKENQLKLPLEPSQQQDPPRQPHKQTDQQQHQQQQPWKQQLKQQQQQKQQHEQHTLSTQTEDKILWDSSVSELDNHLF